MKRKRVGPEREHITKPPSAHRPLWRRWWVITLELLVVLFVVAAAIAGTTRGTTTTTSPTTTSATSSAATTAPSTTATPTSVTGAPPTTAVADNVVATDNSNNAVTPDTKHLPSGEPLPTGAYNPSVTQADISTTICVSGWTATVRPPPSYTTALKRRQMTADGLTGPLSNYEEDHFIPLELGGAPRDPNNLWPQPWNGADGAHEKDKAEHRLHAEVCAGTITLAEGRELIVDPNQWH